MAHGLSLGDARQNRCSTLQAVTCMHARPITFGVEIEAVVAFKQQLLQSVLDRYYDSTPIIVKSFPDSAHDCFLQEEDFSHTCRNLYPSWVLQVSSELGSDLSLQVVGQQSTSITGRPGKVRKYLAEPLIIVKEALEKSGITSDVKAQWRRKAETLLLGEHQPMNQIVLRTQSADYGKWTVTSDHTLIGSLEQQLHSLIGDSLFGHNTVIDPDGTTRVVRERYWDSSGFELISPIFDYSDKTSAFSTIKQCLETLINRSDSRLMGSTWASLQVHVGIGSESSQNDTLRLLQHLAYILIGHEDLLSKLHPRTRCGLPIERVSPASGGEFGQSDNLEGASEDDLDDFDPDAPLPPDPTPGQIAAEDEEYRVQNDQRVLEAEASYTGFNTVCSNARYFSRVTSSTYPPTSAHTALHILDPNVTLTHLISLLQKPSLNSEDAVRGHRYRGYMYNFDNLLTMYLRDTDTWKIGKPTIEFRQHACSIDAEEVRHWVELCFALVRFAQIMAEKEVSDDHEETASPMWEKQAAKYTVWPCQTIEEFLGRDYLDIGGEEIRYWVDRFERYKDYRPTEEEIDYESV